MSDEERSGDSYIRHPPSYRSKALSDFITKLDARLDKEKKIHPRLMCMQGSPHKKSIPMKFKKWTVKKELWKERGPMEQDEEQSLEHSPEQEQNQELNPAAPLGSDNDSSSDSD